MIQFLGEIKQQYSSTMIQEYNKQDPYNKTDLEYNKQDPFHDTGSSSPQWNWEEKSNRTYCKTSLFVLQWWFKVLYYLSHTQSYRV